MVFHDPNVEDGLDKSIGVERVDTLKELMNQSDIVSVNCWLDSSNHHLLGKYVLNRVWIFSCSF